MKYVEKLQVVVIEREYLQYLAPPKGKVMIISIISGFSPLLYFFGARCDMLILSFLLTVFGVFLLLDWTEALVPNWHTIFLLFQDTSCIPLLNRTCEEL